MQIGPMGPIGLIGPIRQISKDQLQRELPFASFIRRDRHAADVAVIQEIYRYLEVRVVERVERFGAKLQPQPFSQLEILQQRQIHAAKTWTNQDLDVNNIFVRGESFAASRRQNQRRGW